MSFSENTSSDSGQIEKARQDLLLACREAADRAQQEQERKTVSEIPQKPQEIPPEVNFEITQATDEESVIAIEQVDPDETDQSVPAETDEMSLTVQPENIEPKPIIPDHPTHRNHNPFVEDILKGIVSEDIHRLRQQLANKP